VGRFEESVREARLAVQLDPLSVVYRQQLIGSLLYAGDLEALLVEAAKLLELEPDNDTAYYWLGAAYLQMGEHERAVAALEKAMQLNPDDSSHPPLLAYIQALAGHREEALRVLEGASASGVHVPLKEIAIVHAALGDPDRAFEYLDRAYEEERASLFYITADDSFEPLHSDPRWEELLWRLGLE
jgi:tetratricopeptide (TPR) repeat protein